MTDRELLELAAKVAGIDAEDIDYEWNPLVDDGDALRLAVRLGIAPIQDKNNEVCAAYWTDVHCCHSVYKDDPFAATHRAIVRFAATRRAIVRAAAEIGKGMP